MIDIIRRRDARMDRAGQRSFQVEVWPGTKVTVETGSLCLTSSQGEQVGDPIGDGLAVLWIQGGQTLAGRVVKATP